MRSIYFWATWMCAGITAAAYHDYSLELGHGSASKLHLGGDHHLSEKLPKASTLVSGANTPSFVRRKISSSGPAKLASVDRVRAGTTRARRTQSQSASRAKKDTSRTRLPSGSHTGLHTGVESSSHSGSFAESQHFLEQIPHDRSLTGFPPGHRASLLSHSPWDALKYAFSNQRIGGEGPVRGGRLPTKPKTLSKDRGISALSVADGLF